MRLRLVQLVRMIAAVELSEAFQVGGRPGVFALQEGIDFALGGGALVDGLAVGGARGRESVTGVLEAALEKVDGGFERFDGRVPG